MTEVIQPAVIQSVKEDAVRMSAVSNLVYDLQVQDAESYQSMDMLLAKVRQAKHNVEERLNPIIKPIYDGLQSLYKLKNELLKPLEDCETAGRYRMKQFKTEETRILREAEEARLREVRRLEQEAAAKFQAEASARTVEMKTRLANQRVVIEQQAQQAAAVPMTTPVYATGSTTYTIKKYRVLYPAMLYNAIADGLLPQDIAPVQAAVLERYLKSHNVDPVKLGIESYDEVQIRSRAGR